ncbi:MAG: ABC transporter permease, partial [Pseudomonadota bacterium]
MRLSRSQRILLGAIPIVLVLAIYLFAASQRHAINPSDKLLPLPGAMIDAMGTLIFKPDPLSGDYLFWSDTLASLRRL